MSRQTLAMITAGMAHAELDVVEPHPFRVAPRAPVHERQREPEYHRHEREQGEAQEVGQDEAPPDEDRAQRATSRAYCGLGRTSLPQSRLGGQHHGVIYRTSFLTRSPASLIPSSIDFSPVMISECSSLRIVSMSLVTSLTGISRTTFLSSLKAFFDRSSPGSAVNAAVTASEL